MPIVVTQTPPTSIVITQVDAGNVTVEAQPQSTIVISSVGVQGPAGGGGGGGSQEVYVQATQPVAPGPWLWIETGLAPGGTGFTFWFEDGV
jgi:hypothetical protein